MANSNGIGARSPVGASLVRVYAQVERGAPIKVTVTPAHGTDPVYGPRDSFGGVCH